MALLIPSPIAFYQVNEAIVGYAPATHARYLGDPLARVQAFQEAADCCTASASVVAIHAE